MITEALLEMHYHHAIVKAFESVYGAKFLRILKPSPQREVWVGFDQGWARTTMSSDTLFEELRSAIADERKQLEDFYLGYFLQFKRVEEMVRKSPYMPTSYDTPYYRAELSVTPNENTGLSQHETLVRLCNVEGAQVSYVCPMLFSENDVWVEPNTEELVFMDVSSAPKGWATNERHFVTFQDTAGSDAMWASEPTPGKAISFDAWVSNEETKPPKLTGEEVVQLITAAKKELSPAGGDDVSPTSLPPSFSLVRLGVNPD